MLELRDPRQGALALQHAAGVRDLHPAPGAQASLAEGGLPAVEARNRRKAAKLYAAIDGSGDYYRGHAQPESRSWMNVTYRLPSEELEKKFVAEATAAGLDGLKGHRSVGGIRASIYNAFPEAGVDALVAFMADFAQKNG